MTRLRESLGNFNISGDLRYDEPLAVHTSFRVGGPADVYAFPADADDVAMLLRAAASCEAPVFVLGGGANILVSDRGIRGLVLDMSRLQDIGIVEHSLVAGAGCAMSDVAAFAADRGFAGPDFLYAMPGSVGGSVWMNARCYGRSLSDILQSVELVNAEGEVETYLPQPDDFAYKTSPFQRRRCVICRATIALEPTKTEEVWRRMREIEADRRSKGHYDAPSAGSVFKNNRDFGKPTGRIIDEIGLKGFVIGDAQVSPQHGNIIINRGNASAEDVLSLIEHVEVAVRRETGLILEREVIPVGDWSTRGTTDQTVP